MCTSIHLRLLCHHHGQPSCTADCTLSPGSSPLLVHFVYCTAVRRASGMQISSSALRYTALQWLGGTGMCSSSQSSRRQEVSRSKNCSGHWFKRQALYRIAQETPWLLWDPHFGVGERHVHGRFHVPAVRQHPLDTSTEMTRMPNSWALISSRRVERLEALADNTVSKALSTWAKAAAEHHVQCDSPGVVVNLLLSGQFDRALVCTHWSDTGSYRQNTRDSISGGICGAVRSTADVSSELYCLTFRRILLTG